MAVDFASLVPAVTQAEPEALPAIVGHLAQAEAVARARMASSAAPPITPPASPQPDRWLTPKEAAAIPGVKVKRIYDWARGQRWASHLTSRCLRIDEAGFRRWLSTRR